jgi:hypothetical protein
MKIALSAALFGCLLAIAAPAQVTGQEAPVDGAATDGAPVDGASVDGAAAVSETPTGFGSIRLGMTLEETRSALERELSFDYRGEPEVSFLPLRERRLLEVQGRSFVRRGFFQFIDGRLYSIILDLNADVLDHYGLYTQLTDKYGESTRLNPREILWLYDDVRLTLERPLTVKYVDREVYERLLQEGAETESLREIVRDEFLQRF